MTHVFVSKETEKGIGYVPENVKTGVERLIVRGVEGDEVEGGSGSGEKAKL